jgi:hypothetical protein
VIVVIYRVVIPYHMGLFQILPEYMPKDPEHFEIVVYYIEYLGNSYEFHSKYV